MNRKVIRIAGATLIALLTFTVTTEAASLCAMLRTRLNSANETIGNTQETRVYARAIAQQNQEIQKVRSDIRRLGCSSGSLIVFGGPNAESCQVLTTTLDHMQDNLSALKNHKTNINSPGLSKSSRKRLLDALEANGCNDVKDETEVASTNYPYTSASFAAGANISVDGENYEIRNLGGNSVSGNLQTVCVRTCDGAFFPISSTASQKTFERDAKVCSMMCPGMETELFFHATGSQETSQMVSAVNGSAYSEMPFAFKYRSAPAGGTKQCGCNFGAYYNEMMRREEGKFSPLRKEETANLPQFGTDLQLRSALSKPLETAPPPAKPYDPSKHTVRQVGPSFLPATEKKIDLANPLGTYEDED